MNKVNLLNPKAASELTKRLSRNHEPHVSAWANSTLARWLAYRSDLVVQCCDRVTYNSPLMVMLRRVLTTDKSRTYEENIGVAVDFHVVVSEELPEWAQTALAKNELYHWMHPGEAEMNKLIHMLDFCATLPARQIKATVESLPDDVEFVRHFDDPDSCFLVKLVTENGYKSEGSIMHHCVGTAGYWGRSRTSIYSLRKPGQQQPIATIELRGSNRIAQVRGPRNRDIAPEMMELIKLWANENQMSFDDDECEDEDEGDECGMDEEDYDEEDEDEDDVPVRRHGGRARDDDDEEEEDDEEDDEDERPRARLPAKPNPNRVGPMQNANDDFDLKDLGDEDW